MTNYLTLGRKRKVIPPPWYKGVVDEGFPPYPLGFLICCNISKRFFLQWKAFELPYKIRYILLVVTLLKVCDVTKHGHHLGFYQELEILKMKKWSSQWTRFMQLRKESRKKKFRTSTGFGLVPAKEMRVDDIWNKSYMNCGKEMKMKKWSSQWTQFMQLRKEALKEKKIQDFNGVWTRDLAIPGAMLYQLSYEAFRLLYAIA